MKHIPLRAGVYALVDDSDYDWLVAMGSWRLNSSGYAVHYTSVQGRRRTLLMHRLILDAPPDLQVDHINRDRLDNQRANLRFATRSQNQANKDIQRNNTSRFKGVVWNSGKWEARIRRRGLWLHLGRYRDPTEAALAYDAASRLLFAEFAGCNFPDRIAPDHIKSVVRRHLARRLRA